MHSAPDVYVGPHPPKRARTSAGFTLRSCANLAPAGNPTAFQRYPLHEEQRRSLAWMLSQEEARLITDGPKGGILADKMGYGKTAITIGLISLQPPVATSHRRGTDHGPAEHLALDATLILAPRHLMEQWQAEFKKFLGEDRVEILKPLRRPPATAMGRGQRPQVGLTPASDDRWRVLVVSDVRELATFLWGDLHTVDVVLASYAVQADQRYAERVKELTLCSVTDCVYSFSGTEEETGVMKRLRDGQRVPKTRTVWHRTLLREGLPLELRRTELPTLSVMEQKMQALRERVRQWTSTPAQRRQLLTEKKPIFEIFWWRRLVMDEFHESESWVYRVREMFKNIGATSRWGLSGTPPISDVRSVDEIAKILWYLKPEPNLVRRPFCRASEEELLVGDQGQTFLNAYVRQNVSLAVEDIRVVSDIVYVQLKPLERALYLQECHDRGVNDAEDKNDKVDLETRNALLRRCAHFSPARGRCENLDTEVRRMTSEKQDRVQNLKRQIELETIRVALLVPDALGGLIAPDMLGPSPHKDVVDFAHKLCSQWAQHGRCGCSLQFVKPELRLEATQLRVEYEGQNGELLVEPRVVFLQPVDAGSYYRNSADRHAVQHAVSRLQKQKEADRVLKNHTICSTTCCGDLSLLSPVFKACLGKLFTMLTLALRSLDFWHEQLRAVRNEETMKCSICLEEITVTTACALPCAHIFHMNCVRAALNATKRLCPLCCQEVAPDTRLSPLQLELEAPPTADTSPAHEDVPAHGTKLNLLAQKLREIRKGDSSAKVIVFSQWQVIEAKVADALTSYSIPFLRTQPRKDNGEALRRFQDDVTSPYVLLLSLESAASGSNLQAANHVIFVHPMSAESSPMAVAQERQAIGRVRRLGQKRPEIFVHRFVTRGTIEEHLSTLHEAESREANERGAPAASD